VVPRGSCEDAQEYQDELDSSTMDLFSTVPRMREALPFVANEADSIV
jgi:hypothetical protein